MALSESELITRYFRNCGAQRRDVTLGVGDDAALLECPHGMQLVAATDTLVAGVHFPNAVPAATIGHRALAVNLSDLAAMGARPAWALLALTLPEADEQWLAEFAAGLGALARAHDVALIGGDTTRGPLTVTVQLLGHVPHGRALTRAGGRGGDLLYVSGSPGDAGAGLAIEQGRLAAPPEAAGYLRERFLLPTPRVALGERLREYARACIDVSDGLLGDAGKLAAASGVGLEISFEALPVSPQLTQTLGAEAARELALTAGDDYELLFAVDPARAAELERELPPSQWNFRHIGALRAAHGAVVTRAGTVMEFSHSGYRHFA
ncbi:MAG TPA: thiamine-phosphate kinase [Steroidobacteraceae bacterium]|jgi:thiamine-monophosphate kinase|nr:thiamine-phosphate kinase [Steroidobacteraceae bacterium]